jgi:hypothetical protein
MEHERHKCSACGGAGIVLSARERATEASARDAREPGDARTVKGQAAIRKSRPVERMGSDQASPISTTLYMVVEHFKNKDAVPVYRRFRDKGRMAPQGLVYISSWVDDKLERCFQLMETHDRNLLDEWLANWSDLVDFEVYPVIRSKEAAERIAPQL